MSICKLTSPLFRTHIFSDSTILKVLTFVVLWSCLFIPARVLADQLPQFTEITQDAGIAFVHNNGAFGKSCAWFDYDLDGNLDIYVANYVEWSIEIDIFCTLDGKNKSYCTPESYKGQASRLYQNRGDGTFEDVSRIAGINDPFSKSLGVCILDFNQDGLPDIFEANDTQPNKLYQNNGNGKFEEFS